MPKKDGKPTFGKRNKIVHALCRRCGKHSLHLKTGVCSACGFGRSAKIRRYNWQAKRGISVRERRL